MKLRLLSALLLVAACGSAAPTPTQPATPVEVTPSDMTSRPPPEDPVPPGQKALSPGEEHLALCRALIAGAKAQQDLVIGQAGAARTIDATLVPFNELMRLLSNAGALASLMQSVHPDQGVRDAARACESEVSQYSSELSLNRPLYDAVAAVDVKAADATTQRFHMTSLRDMKRAGVTLDDAQRTRIAAIDEEMTALGQQIQQAIAEDTRYIEVTDAKRLAGMPEDWIALHKPDAQGVIKISTDYPDYIPFVTYAADDELRKQLYIKFRSRGDKTNEALFTKLFTLRAEKAKLLGFATWADYQSDDKMLRGGKAAQDFIDRITKLAKPRAKRDYAELLAQLKKTDKAAKSVGDWQKALLETQLKKEKYAVDSQVVRTYFPYEQTLAGLLDITSTLYDVKFAPVTNVVTWHSSVKVFDVTRGSTVLGRIYLDMHPRADKYKHAAQFTLLTGVTDVQRPEGVLVCNFPEGSSLMEHGDVVTMFHEFGHLMHHVLGGNQRWVSQSGVATEHDFVEAPSQMFEEWGWSHETLARFAKNAQGEVIPKQLVDAMNKSRGFGEGIAVVQQMLYAALALQYHQADPAKLDQLAVLKTLQAKYTPFAYVEGTKFHTSFGHLVGYSSMYYTYMWSKVIAADLLTPFKKAGLMSTATAHAYRDKVLAAGGTKPAADLVADFLGRPYNFKAFEKYLAGK